MTAPGPPALVDCHFHVGLRGDRWPEWGGFSDAFLRERAFRVFRRYAGIGPDEVRDEILLARTRETIEGSGMDAVVCLALDPAHREDGTPYPTGPGGEVHMWVATDYVFHLRETIGPRVLVGASIHPYDPRFEPRLRDAAERGAALLKWLPSSQRIDLADPRVGAALRLAARARPGGRPLPVLIHAGPEYGIPGPDPRARSWDFLGWTLTDRLANLLRRPRWYVPRIAAARRHLEEALDAGGVIVFAHCGLPYFASGWLGRLLEHSDFGTVREILRANGGAGRRGKAYADVSAICTPFRWPFWRRIRDQLPADALLYGSDFPVPVFVRGTDEARLLRDFIALLTGNPDDVEIPPGNLAGVTHREVSQYFGGDHPMFSAFARELAPDRRLP